MGAIFKVITRLNRDMDEEDKRRTVYESTLVEDLQSLMSSSRFTAKCHYNRVETMRNYQDYCKIATQLSGVSGILAPVIQNKPCIRVAIPLCLGILFFSADRLGNYFGAEKERSFRGACKWMNLYTRTIEAKSQILSRYITAYLYLQILTKRTKLLSIILRSILYGQWSTEEMSYTLLTC